MQNLTAQNDLLTLTFGLTAAPAVSFQKADGSTTVLPSESTTSAPNGFSVYLDAVLPYDSLSRVVNGYMAGKRFDVIEGLFARHIVVQEVTVAGNSEGNLLLKVNFAGSFNVTAFFTGKPVYNPENKTLAMQDLQYDLQTKNLLLKGAKWLLAGKIEKELKKASSIDLSNYFTTTQQSLNNYLNKEWTKGISGSGLVKDLWLVEAKALPQHLLIRTACQGDLSIRVTEIDLGFNR